MSTGLQGILKQIQNHRDIQSYWVWLSCKSSNSSRPHPPIEQEPVQNRLLLLAFRFGEALHAEAHYHGTGEFGKVERSSVLRLYDIPPRVLNVIPDGGPCRPKLPSR